MTKKPFQELGQGDIFISPRNSAAHLMKTANDAAVVLVSHYDCNERMDRGSIMYFKAEALVGVPEQEAITLSVSPEAPVDKPLALWKAGDMLKVGTGLTRKLAVFAGLYVHAGPRDKLGCYYSSEGNQVMVLEVPDAQIQAYSDGVELIIVDALNPSEFELEPIDAAA